MYVSPGLVVVILLLLGNGESVTQKGGEMIVSEGAFLTINCTYTTAGFPYLFWYVQYPREGPQLLFRVTKSGEKSSHVGFEATYNRENTSFHLKKASVHESDSAVFYCALMPGATEELSSNFLRWRTFFDSGTQVTQANLPHICKLHFLLSRCITLSNNFAFSS
uniref:Ig-like domain-containing protein n=1 Tax=Castor canadensis TaxID=51338 RepID=A0A8C0WI63_CASCN